MTMSSEKGIFVKDIQDSQEVAGLFLVKTMSRSETKNGNPYLMLTLIDSSGEIAGRVWDNADQLMAECAAGSIVSISRPRRRNRRARPTAAACSGAARARRRIRSRQHP